MKLEFLINLVKVNEQKFKKQYKSLVKLLGLQNSGCQNQYERVNIKRPLNTLSVRNKFKTTL